MLTALRRRAGIAGTAAALGLVLAACGGGDDETADDATETTTETSEEMTSEEMTSEEMTSEEMTDEATDVESEMDTDAEVVAAEPIGEACSQLPEGAAEELAGMTVDQAAANTELLSTLATAVESAGLGQTLADLDDATVFAPINPAFEALPEGQLDSLLADTDQLTAVLTTHVLPQTVQAEDIELGVPATTVQGTELTFEEGDGELPMVSTPSSSAQIVCANIVTDNATVHLIDGVLLPADSSGDEG